MKLLAKIIDRRSRTVIPNIINDRNHMYNVQSGDLLISVNSALDIFDITKNANSSECNKMIFHINEGNKYIKYQNGRFIEVELDYPL